MSQSSGEGVKDAINRLKEKDKVGNAGEFLAVLAGIAGGAGSAGPLAAATGMTTVPFLTSLFGHFGIVFLSATPVGWVISSSIVGGFAIYAVGKMIRSGGKQDQVRQDIVDRLNKKLHERKKSNIPNHSDGQHANSGSTVFNAYILHRLEAALEDALKRELIEQEQAKRIAKAVITGKLDASIALDRLKAISS